LFAKEGFMYVVQGMRGAGEMPMHDFEEILYNTNALIGNNYDGDSIELSMVFPYNSYEQILVMLLPQEDKLDVSPDKD